MTAQRSCEEIAEELLLGVVSDSFPILRNNIILALQAERARAEKLAIELRDCLAHLGVLVDALPVELLTKKPGLRACLEAGEETLAEMGEGE